MLLVGHLVESRVLQHLSEQYNGFLDLYEQCVHLAEKFLKVETSNQSINPKVEEETWSPE